MAIEKSVAEIHPIDEEVSKLFEDLEEAPEDIACDLMDLFRYQIGRRLQERDMDQTDLADAMEVSPPVVSRLLNGDNTTLLSIARAAKALDLVVSALKLVPEEEMPDQVDEVKSFVRSECNGAGWWPVTRRKSSFLRHRLNELYPSFAESSESSRESKESFSVRPHSASDDYSESFEPSAA